MQEKELYIISLAYKYVQNELSAEEKTLLEEWLEENATNREYFNELTSDFTMMEDLKYYHNVDSEGMWQKTMSQLQQQQQLLHPEPVKRITIRTILVAAAIAGIVGYIGIKVAMPRKQQVKQAQTTTTTPPVPTTRHTANQEAPFGTTAMLTLADGSKLQLKDVHEGFEQQQGSVKLVKKNNDLVYLPVHNTAATSKIYNTLEIPPGGKYRLILPDGSRIYLNASSTITFPVFSADSMRQATMSGQAYCEIAHNPDNPFYLAVQSPDNKDQRSTLKVLGTRFNVTAYPNEKYERISLKDGYLELYTMANTGRNRHASNGIPTIMHSGDQTLVDTKGIVEKIKDADVESDIAWINGDINFNKTPVDEVAWALGRKFGLKVRLQPETVKDHPINVRFPATVPLTTIVGSLNSHYEDAFVFKYNEDEKTLLVTAK
jgi:ferric-dicitrate binding protein FerR (iron transport regulator)